MDFEEGVDPKIFEEEKSDISKAKAGRDLFQINKESTHGVETKQLFDKVTEAKINQSQDEMLFESQIENVGNRTQSVTQEKGDIGSFLVIGICILLIVTYIVYVFQKRSIKKMIKNSRNSVMQVR